MAALKLNAWVLLATWLMDAISSLHDMMVSWQNKHLLSFQRDVQARVRVIDIQPSTQQFFSPSIQIIYLNYLIKW